MSSQIVWFRRDLRLTDHPALGAALADCDEGVIPVFCLDPRLLHGRHRSGPRTQFLLECLAELRSELASRGSGLVVRSGPPERELPALARELGVAVVHASADVSPYARRRDERVERALGAAGAELRLHPGIFIVDDPASVLTADGRPYTVFSSYHRSWRQVRRRELAEAPDTLPALPEGLKEEQVPALEDLGLEQAVAEPDRGGASRGRERLEEFLDERAQRYDRERQMLGPTANSRLSPYLHFGCVSALEVEQRLPAGPGKDAFRRELCWRDFYAHVLYHFSQNARVEHQPRYRGRLQWENDTAKFDAWREGRTGYPSVDAAMRQLRREGWIHNRGRLIAASFLIKDLAIDWRWGERWFMRMLIDGDEANNNGNWQWIASVGVDPQPPYRRLYNPARQQGRFDPHGIYVRQHVPELERVPDEFLAEPWKMPEEVQAASGCVIGRDYPAPIVDHAQARREALDRYAAAAGV